MIHQIAEELSLNYRQVQATIQLLDEGGTVPFISRYRKERTENLDEVQIAAIRDRATQLRELSKRKESILKSIAEQGKLSEELKLSIEAAASMTALEDLYLPFKPKRRTKATIAREAGLEPLAEKIYAQEDGIFPDIEAQEYLNPEKNILGSSDALQGARDIIAEWINEDAEVRAMLRTLFLEESMVKAKVISGKEEEGIKYKDYYEWEEPIQSIASHRMLALRRGEKEMILSLDIAPDEGTALFNLENLVVRENNSSAEQVRQACLDAYKRLLKPSLETEARMNSKFAADEEAIRVFAGNLKELLLSSPLGQKKILAVDPGFRTGCKLAALDAQGKLLAHTTIYPHPPQNQSSQAEKTVLDFYAKYFFEAIAVGNGTAGKETIRFMKSISFPKDIPVILVNESGASIYSASEVAREEFPDLDLTVRGTVSIGRRLLDPLAELVKLDPKSIGVGQYQHDVDQSTLKKSLDDTVISCVNAVGVDLNTASAPLLSYVAGLGPALAKNIVKHREQNGPFRDRSALKSVARLGEKAFEQAAGFLRISGSTHPLDASAVHPERYALVEQMAKDLGVSIKDLMHSKELRQQIKIQLYVTNEVGLPTLHDIMEELAKPGRDPRKSFDFVQFSDSINEISDLRQGMVLPGVVTNITNFGAFVDIGVHQDGLVHISHLADRFVKDPMDVVRVNQKVQVTIMEVDVARKRIALSMKANPFEHSSTPKREKQEITAKKNHNPKADLDALKNKFRR